MKDTNQLTARDKIRSSWVIARPLIGGALGSIIYIVIAKTIIDNTTMSCAPETIRLVIEATLLPASVLVESFGDEPVLYLLSSIPYAILGSSILSSKIETSIVVSICIVGCFLLSSFVLMYGYVLSCSG